MTNYTLIAWYTSLKYRSSHLCSEAKPHLGHARTRMVEYDNYKGLLAIIGV